MIIHNKDVVKRYKQTIPLKHNQSSDEELEVPLLPTSSPNSDKPTKWSQIPQVDTSTHHSDRFWEVDESNILPEDAKWTRAPLNLIFYYHKIALTKDLLPPRKSLAVKFRSDKQLWMDAYMTELSNLEAIGKMRVIPRPAGVDVIPLLELFVVKWDNLNAKLAGWNCQ